MRALLIVSLLLFGSIGLCNGVLVVGTTQSSPSAGTVLANTGTLTSGGTAGGWYYIQATCSTTVAVVCNVELFDGSVVQKTIQVPLTAISFSGFSTGNVTTYIPDGWSIRVKNKGLALGDVQATIAYEVKAID